MSTIDDLYLSMQGGLSRMVARMVPRDEVDDIVQETYIRLRKAVLAQEIRHPRSYIYQTARNLALDSLKKGGSARPVEWCDDAEYIASPGDTTVETVESDESFIQFCDAVQSLPSRAQQAFILKKVYGHTQREIAAELEIAESTVEKHVALAMRRCAEHMTRANTAKEAA